MSKIYLAENGVTGYRSIVVAKSEDVVWSAMLSHVLAHTGTWWETWTTVLLKGKRSTEIDGVCIIEVFIAWVGSVSSI